MEKVIWRRLKERDEVITVARRWAEGLKIKCSVVLIGSYARGDFNVWSDVDVILIGEFRGNPLQRLRNIDCPPGFEVIPLSPSEFIALLKKKNPIAVEAVNCGIVIRDDFKLFHKD